MAHWLLSMSSQIPFLFWGGRGESWPNNSLGVGRVLCQEPVGGGSLCHPPDSLQALLPAHAPLWFMASASFMEAC